MGSREERFTRLFSFGYGRVWAYVRRRVPAADVEDVVADTFTVAWRRLDQVPEGERSLAWLYAVAHKAVANHLRAQRRRLRLLSRIAREPVAPEPGADPRVLEGLATLRWEDQEVLRLAAWEQLGAAEIAAVLGCSENAAALRLSRARRKLRDRLTGSGPSRTQTPRKELHG